MLGLFMTHIFCLYMVKSKSLQLFAFLSFPFMTGMLHSSSHASLSLSLICQFGNAPTCLFLLPF